MNCAASLARLLDIRIRFGDQSGVMTRRTPG